MRRVVDISKDEKQRASVNVHEGPLEDSVSVSSSASGVYASVTLTCDQALALSVAIQEVVANVRA